MAEFQIYSKLNELYDMTQIEANEYMPDEFFKKLDFYLPDNDYYDLIKKKEEVARVQGIFVPPPVISRHISNRRKRRDSGSFSFKCFLQNVVLFLLYYIYNLLLIIICYYYYYFHLLGTI